MTTGFSHPIPGVDAAVDTEVAEERGVLVLGDDGTPAKPGQLLLETDRQRRQRRVSYLIGAGWTRERILDKVAREFGVTRNTVAADLTELADVARQVADDEGFTDLIVVDALNKLRHRQAVLHRDAMSPVNPAEVFGDGKVMEALLRAKVSAAKEARATAETLVDIVGRRSRRWSPKQTVEVTPVSGGTAEQQEAVRRLLGEDAPQTPPEEQP